MGATVVNAEAPPDLDQRIVLRNVSWEQYEALLALFGDDPPGIRMAYLEGALEIMSPSRKHETIKKMVVRLVELYALERGISLTGLGSTTFRRAAKERGVEPDECYCVSEDKPPTPTHEERPRDSHGQIEREPSRMPPPRSRTATGGRSSGADARRDAAARWRD